MRLRESGVRSGLGSVGFAAFLAAIAGVLVPNEVGSVSLPQSADVEILEPIAIIEDANLNFGQIVPPSSGVQDFTVGFDGSMTPGAGDGSAVGGHSAGQYDITGTDGESYQLTVSSSGCTDASLLLLSVEADVSLPLQLDELDIKVGGKLRVGSAASPGAHTCNYFLEAEYS